MKVENDQRNKFPNLSSERRRLKKKSGLQRDPVETLIFFFSLLLSNCLSWEIYYHFKVKAGVHMKAVFWLGIMVLTQISQAVKNLYANPTYLCSGPFCIFFDDF